MLSGKQIRAARVLAGWDIKDLAPRAGLSITAVQNIETGAVPKPATLGRIIKTFSDAGIEFLDNEGVRRKPTNIDVLIGSDGLRQFFDGVHDYASSHGGTIMMFGIDETTFIETITPEFSQNYLNRMTEVSRRRGDLEVLAITCEGDTNFCASDYNEYRWISKDLFQFVPFYIYGETLAIMDFNTTPGPIIMLLKSPAVANAYRKQFQAFWKMAYPPTYKKGEK